MFRMAFLAFTTYLSHAEPSALLIIAVDSLLVLFLLHRFVTRSHSAQGELPVPGRWVPFLGHAPAMLLWHTDFMAWCRKHHGLNYKLLLPGQNMTVISHPDDVAFLMKKSIKEIGAFRFQSIESFTGISPSKIPELYPFLHDKVYPAMSRALSRSRLPGLMTRTTHNLHFLLQQFAPKESAIASASIFDFVANVMYCASTQTLFGKSFPDAVTAADLMAMDDEIYWLLNNVPFFSRKGIRERELIAAKVQLFVEHHWKPSGAAGDNCLVDGSDVVSEGILALTSSGYSLAEASRVLVALLHGAHANLIHTASWVMVYLTSNPYSLIRVRDAVRAAYPTSQVNASDFEQDLIDVPLLDSAIKEAMRLASLPSSSRTAMVDIVVPGVQGPSFVIRKGEAILIDVRGMHLDPATHIKPDIFRVDRFLDQSGSLAPSAKTCLPFGDGIFMCKGRDYAVRLIKLFFVMFFQMYDVVPWGYTPPPTVKRATSILHVNYDALPQIKFRLRTGTTVETR